MDNPSTPAAVPVDLPPRPKAHQKGWIYTSDQMEAYALAAIEKDRATRSAPVVQPMLRDRLRLIMRRIDELEAKTGVGGWYAESIQETCDAIARDAGISKDYRAALPTAPVARPVGISIDQSKGKCSTPSICTYKTTCRFQPCDHPGRAALTPAAVAQPGESS